MFITNNHNNLVISLSTNTSETLSLTYKSQAYTDGEPTGSPVTHTVSPSIVDGKLVFNIPLSDYNVGDELKEFKVSGDNSTVNLWDTHEGITVLCNGEVIDVMPVYNNSIETETYVVDGETKTEKKVVNELHRNKFALNFDKDGAYTLQAVYRGNDATEMSYTTPYTFQVKQPSQSGGGGGTPVNGVYKLEFVNKNLSSMVYDDKTIIQFKLTKGGQPVGGKTIETVLPNGSIASKITTSKGLVQFTNSEFDVGQYKIGAYFIDQQDDDNNNKTTVSTYKTVKITKATPSIWHTASPISLGTKLQIKIRDSHSNNFKSKKVMIYINGKPQTTKTNESGNVWIPFKKAGTYKIKVVSTATANHKQVTQSFNFKVNSNG